MSKGTKAWKDKATESWKKEGFEKEASVYRRYTEGISGKKEKSEDKDHESENRTITFVC